MHIKTKAKGILGLKAACPPQPAVHSKLLRRMGYKDGRSLLLAAYYLYASVGTPPAHNSGIYDAAPCI